MELRSIRPAMDGMHEKDGLATIVIEATEEEAAEIGVLLFSRVRIIPDDTYVEEPDPVVDQFIKACCEEGAAFSVPASDLYDGFLQWCEERGFIPLSMRNFGRWMQKLGYQRKRSELIRYLGLRLLSASSTSTGGEQ